MHYLQVKDLSYSYRNQRTILDGVDFSIQKGQKIALIARNGMGKTTLLNLLMGKLECSQGEIIWNTSCRIGFLPQQLRFPDNMKIQDYFDDHNTDYYDYQEWKYTMRLEQILRELGITHLLDQTRETLSGGEQKRISLAKILLDEPDVLVLDEPTNHLDLDMINRLEKYLQQSSLTLLMVTHDRYFLERVCTHIVELDRGHLYRYKGNYSQYVLKKAERLEKERKDMHKLKQEYRRELSWSKKSPRAREVKSVKREKEFFALQEDLQQKTVDYRESNKTIDIAVVNKGEKKILGNKILTLKGVYKSFWSDSSPDAELYIQAKEDSGSGSEGQQEKKILVDFSHEFRYDERIGIVGNNGVGKTTFLNIIVGEEPIDRGRRELSERVEFGYYAQQESLPQDVKVIDYAKSIADYMTLGNKKLSTVKLLEKFLFRPEQQQQRISDLSGGEQRRLSLLTTLMKRPNFLILDEPTNDLDIDTMNALEDFLLQYHGCLIVISHDRYFMDKIAGRIFSFEGEGVVEDFQGDYSRYTAWKANKTTAPDGALQEQAEEELELAVAPAKLSYHEKKEFDRLMNEIIKLEKQQEKINILFQTTQPSHEELKKLGKKLNDLGGELEQKEARWMELSERL